MTEAQKCANAPCECLVESGWRHNKYCSDHCREMGDKIELRCDCQHQQCREA